MQRRRSYYRSKPRAKRPTDRVIRAGQDQYWPVAYALVYVPEGYNVNNLTFPAVTDDMYNPTKMVIISGVCNSAGNEDHKSSRYSRKCAVGDRVALILITTRPSGTQPTNFELSFTVVA